MATTIGSWLIRSCSVFFFALFLVLLNKRMRAWRGTDNCEKRKTCFSHRICGTIPLLSLQCTMVVVTKLRGRNNCQKNCISANSFRRKVSFQQNNRSGNNQNEIILPLFYFCVVQWYSLLHFLTLIWARTKGFIVRCKLEQEIITF